MHCNLSGPTKTVCYREVYTIQRLFHMHSNLFGPTKVVRYREVSIGGVCYKIEVPLLAVLNLTHLIMMAVSAIPAQLYSNPNQLFVCPDCKLGCKAEIDGENHYLVSLCRL